MKRAFRAAGAQATRLDDDIAQVREHLDQPGTLTCQPLLWQAWGVRP